MVQGRHHQHFLHKPKTSLIKDQCSKTTHYKRMQANLLKTSLLGCLGAAFLFLAPVTYYVYQNYQVFQKLSLNIEPSLIVHLQRELTLLTFFSALSIIGIGAAVWFVNKKVLGPILHSAAQVDIHIQKVVETGKLRINEIELFKSEEFASLSQNYQRLIQEFERLQEEEIKAIESLKLDAKFLESGRVSKSILLKKRRMIGKISAVDPDAKSSESVYRQNAS